MPTPEAKRKTRFEIGAQQARRKFRDCLDRAAFGNERIVVGRSGKAMVAIVSMDDLQKLEETEAA